MQYVYIGINKIKSLCRCYIPVKRKVRGVPMRTPRGHSHCHRPMRLKDSCVQQGRHCQQPSTVTSVTDELVWKAWSARRGPSAARWTTTKDWRHRRRDSRRYDEACMSASWPAVAAAVLPHHRSLSSQPSVCYIQQAQTHWLSCRVVGAPGTELTKSAHHCDRTLPSGLTYAYGTVKVQLHIVELRARNQPRDTGEGMVISFFLKVWTPFLFSFPSLPLEVGPWNPARWSGERCKLPQRMAWQNLPLKSPIATMRIGLKLPPPKKKDNCSRHVAVR